MTLTEHAQKWRLDFTPKEPYLKLTPLADQPPLRIGKNELSKGNFWLFQDIFVWHWFYSKYKDQFDECAPERNVFRTSKSGCIQYCLRRQRSELRVQMSEGDLYDESDRMKFIDSIANQYHLLMGTREAYMEGEIRTISTWNNAQ
ncbi:DUF2515 family protein [Pseudomonas migulae]|uniref:DUF2515 family protein n=1 Tax=Pseudomonas migulae TaxID=78543 RepID=UPI003712F32F